MPPPAALLHLLGRKLPAASGPLLLLQDVYLSTSLHRRLRSQPTSVRADEAGGSAKSAGGVLLNRGNAVLVDTPPIFGGTPADLQPATALGAGAQTSGRCLQWGGMGRGEGRVRSWTHAHTRCPDQQTWSELR